MKCETCGDPVENALDIQVIDDQGQTNTLSLCDFCYSAVAEPLQPVAVDVFIQANHRVMEVRYL